MTGLKSRLQANIASKFNVRFSLSVLPCHEDIADGSQPLKCCSPIIVDEFARLSHHLRLIYMSVTSPCSPCLIANKHLPSFGLTLRRYPQIEKNKSVHLSQFFTGSYATGGALRDTGYEYDDEKWAHLEACFPFDPFQLPVAKRWLDLKNNYVAWQPMAVLDRDGDDEEEDEEDDDEEDEDLDEFEGAPRRLNGAVDGRALQEDTATDDGDGDD